MNAFLDVVALTAPLFVLVALGFALARSGRWPAAASDTLSRFVFTVAIPALLFRLMSDFTRLPRVDARLLVAYFGGCLVVYVLARLAGWTLFRMDGTAQSVFATGSIFANTVLVGLPLAKVTLGDEALPAVSLVIAFHSLTLWILVSVSVEWAQHRDLSLPGLARTVSGVLRNPVIIAIATGTAWGFVGWPLPRIVDETLGLVAQAAVPLSLIVLGMGLATFAVTSGWRESAGIVVFKLVVHPLAVFALARLLDLPPVETGAVVLLATLPVGASVYVMSRQFGALSGPVATGIVVTTAASALTTPLTIALLRTLAP